MHFACSDIMSMLTVRNLPEEVHRALRVRAAQHGRSTEAEVREILTAAVKPASRVRMFTSSRCLSPRELLIQQQESPFMSRPFVYLWDAATNGAFKSVKKGLYILHAPTEYSEVMVSNRIAAVKSVGRDTTGCFVAGTPVHTDKGLVPIELIKVGDMVLSKSENGESELVYKPVVKTFDFEDKEIWLVEFTSRDCYSYDKFQSGEISRCEEYMVGTPNHLFWVVGEVLYYDELQLIFYPKPYWSRLDQLKPYTVVLRADGILARVYAVQPIFEMKDPNLGFLQGYPLGNWWDHEDEDGHFIDFTDGTRISNHKVSNSEAVILPNDDDWCFPVKKGRVFNFQVTDFNNCFVGKKGILVRNMNCGG